MRSAHSCGVAAAKDSRTICSARCCAGSSACTASGNSKAISVLRTAISAFDTGGLHGCAARFLVQVHLEGDDGVGEIRGLGPAHLPEAIDQSPLQSPHTGLGNA